MSSARPVRAGPARGRASGGGARGAQAVAANSPFRLHKVEGPLAGLFEGTRDLLALINRQWRRRRLLAVVLAVVLVGGGAVLLMEAYYIFGLVLGALGMLGSALALSSGRYLEVEVETVELCLALLDELQESLDPKRSGRVLVDMRASSHAAKLNPNASGSIVDHWFTIDLPLQDGTGLRLELTEHLRGDTQRRVGRATRRLERDYHVALFGDSTFDERYLLEAVCSHVSAPTGTSVKARVSEGLEAFNAAIEQKSVTFHARRSRLAEALEGTADGSIDGDDAF